MPNTRFDVCHYHVCSQGETRYHPITTGGWYHRISNSPWRWAFSYYSLLDGTPLKKSDNGKYEIISNETLNARKATVINTLKTRASGIGSTYPSYFPHTGSPKALVILVQFQDVNSRAATPLPPSTITSMPISAQQYLVRMFRYSTRKMSTTVR